MSSHQSHYYYNNLLMFLKACISKCLSSAGWKGYTNSKPVSMISAPVFYTHTHTHTPKPPPPPTHTPPTTHTHTHTHTHPHTHDHLQCNDGMPRCLCEHMYGLAYAFVQKNASIH